MSVKHIGGEKFFNPDSKRLYKDCMRLVFHVASEHKTVNVKQVRTVVKQQFMMNANETDPKKLEELKNAALRALTNYVMHLSQSKGDWAKTKNITDPD
mmetsp:Transcript_31391/g.76927  ORF Transcript_31391/g.76927 Transcript_31391/m.76927 type:complete len:98 (-) Transcript_31391:168-461(-)|eukprot:CAMPEP_0206234440 /NCGR_PEP_ID=MMETSP0047_2-20121206/12595_1 /ASSEMBLY_ACC=CAM_ASM_000192 /TAXON_ID=195065 /ORGANISM="Chroomonas mesostigmatica_cf, Strain CCMP1168" /LENGTH=97 /DNA_ID=CAMNT_0053658533 /DNA_START=123 /DNA_END=416 /DNA_ORIENTATION=+